jgi:hypothetical protein
MMAEIVKRIEDQSFGILAEQRRPIALPVAGNLDEAPAQRLVEKAVERNRRQDLLQNPFGIRKEHRRLPECPSHSISFPPARLKTSCRFVSPKEGLTQRPQCMRSGRGKGSQ